MAISSFPLMFFSLRSELRVLGHVSMFVLGWGQGFFQGAAMGLAVDTQDDWCSSLFSMGNSMAAIPGAVLPFLPCVDRAFYKNGTDWFLIIHMVLIGVMYVWFDFLWRRDGITKGSIELDDADLQKDKKDLMERVPLVEEGLAGGEGLLFPGVMNHL